MTVRLTVRPWLAVGFAVGALAACGNEVSIVGMDGAVVSDASALTDAASADAFVGAPPPPYATLPVLPVLWNPGAMTVGHVASAAEFTNGLVVYSDLGAVVMIGGAIVNTDTSAMAWTSAADVPAADGTPTPWLLSVDTMGNIWQLVDQMFLQNVSDRYGLLGAQVVSVTPLNATGAAFGFTGGFAVADGSTVNLYMDSTFPRTVVGGGGSVAGISGTGAATEVLVFNPATGATLSYPVPFANTVVLDAMGNVAVGANSALFAVASDGALHPAYTTNGSETVHGAVVSAGTLWFATGTELGVLASDGTLRRTSGANIPADATLLPSPSGDVWTLSQGNLGRYTIDTAGLTQVMNWEQTIQPIFLSVCASCHLPGGTANLDLSTYPSWITNRAQIYNQVVTLETMPPAGTLQLSNADRATIAAWAVAAGMMDAGTTDGGSTDDAASGQD